MRAANRVYRAFIGLSLAVLSSRDLPAASSQSPEESRYGYAVKFVCVGEVGPATRGDEVPFFPALYRTVVNVHHFGPGEVSFTKKAVLARSEDLPKGRITGRVEERLGPDEALAIDCNDIGQDLFGGPQPIGDGFLILESRDLLDVVAVYTTQLIEDQTTDDTVRDDQTTTLSDKWEHTEDRDKIVLWIDFPRTTISEEELRALARLGIRPGEHTQVEVVVPVPVGRAGSPEEAARRGLEAALRQALENEGVAPDDAERRARELLSHEVRIEVEIIEYGLGHGVGLGLGVGRGIGIGRGIGRGIGVGLSIDVEYIQPRMLRPGNREYGRENRPN